MLGNQTHGEGGCIDVVQDMIHDIVCVESRLAPSHFQTPRPLVCSSR